MNKIVTEEENKAIQLKILDEVSNFCEANNINYFLFYGTLIGAIRHKGFIPWDDDIDLGMPRKDYEKFIRTFKSENFAVGECQVENDWLWDYAKVYDLKTVKIEAIDYHGMKIIGIDIDIFPIDSCNSAGDVKKIKIRRKIYRIMRYISFTKYRKEFSLSNIVKNAICFLCRPFTRFFTRRIDFLAKKISDRNKNGKLAFLANSSDKAISVFPTEYFNTFEYCEFENKKYRIPKGYDLFLKQVYGDYMELPPENERITHHANNIFYKE